MQSGLPSMKGTFKPVLNTWESCRAAVQHYLLPRLHSTGLIYLKARCHRYTPSPS